MEEKNSEGSSKDGSVVFGANDLNYLISQFDHNNTCIYFYIIEKIGKLRNKRADISIRAH